MKVNTIPGASYALTCTAACTVHALLSGDAFLIVLETENSGQYIFIAPTDAIEVSDEHALVTQTFKAAALGSSARGGMRPGVNAGLKNPTVEVSGLPLRLRPEFSTIGFGAGRQAGYVRAGDAPGERNRYRSGRGMRQDGTYLGRLDRAVLVGSY